MTPRLDTLTLTHRGEPFAWFRVVCPVTRRILGSGFSEAEARAAAEGEERECVIPSGDRSLRPGGTL